MYSDATWGQGAQPTQDDTNTVTTGQLMYSDATWGRGARPTQDDTNTVTTGQLMYSDATWGRGARPTQDDTNTVTMGQLMYSDATWGRGARPVSGPGTSCRSHSAHTGWFGGVPAAATRSAGWSSSESSTRTPVSPRSSAWCLQYTRNGLTVCIHWHTWGEVERMNEWMNELINELINEQTKKQINQSIKN